MKDKRDNQMRPNTSGTCRRIPESRRFEEKKEDRHVEQEVVATEQKDSVFNAYRDILSNFTSNTLTPLVHRNEPTKKKKQRPRSSSPPRYRRHNTYYYNPAYDPISSSKLSSPLVWPNHIERSFEVQSSRSFEVQSVQPVRSFEVQPVENAMPSYTKPHRSSRYHNRLHTTGSKRFQHINRVNSR